MANPIERRLPKPVRMEFKRLVSTGLSLFLALQFNDYINKVISEVLPEMNGIIQEGIALIVLTFMVVYGVIFIEKALDGK